MTVIARFEVIPVREGSMSTAIASALRALDRHPVSYRTTATDTIIEADTVQEVFAAVQAAHEAITEDRVITSVQVDEDRRRPQGIHERVASVEHELGRPAQREGQPSRRTQPPEEPEATTPPQQTPAQQPQGQPRQTPPQQRLQDVPPRRPSQRP